MRRPIILPLILACAAIPVAALAAFGLPSDLLLSPGLSGQPLDFSAKVYMQTGPAEDAVRITGTIEGASEGTGADDIKSNFMVSATAETADGNGEIALDMRIFHSTMYLRVRDLAFTAPGLAEEDLLPLREQIASMQGKWFSITMNDAEQNTPSLDAMFVQWAAMLQNAGMATTGEDLKKFVADLLDAALEMKRTQFLTGNAYDIRLRPDAAKSLMNVINRWSVRMAPSFELNSTADESGIGELLHIVGDALNVHMKIDTNSEGAFRFGKYYVSFAMPESDMTFAIEGTMQHRTTPVYLEIPKITQPIETLVNGIGGDWFLPTPDLPLDDGDLYLDGTEYSFPRTRPRGEQKPVFLPEDTAEILRQTCGAPTDAPEQSLQYARKGACGVRPLSRRHLHGE